MFWGAVFAVIMLSSCNVDIGLDGNKTYSADMPAIIEGFSFYQTLVKKPIPVAPIIIEK